MTAWNYTASMTERELSKERSLAYQSYLTAERNAMAVRSAYEDDAASKSAEVSEAYGAWEEAMGRCLRCGVFERT